MRYARIKPDQIDTFMHVYNRTVGSTGEFPFKDAEKEEFVRRIHLVSQLYVIRSLTPCQLTPLFSPPLSAVALA